MTLRTRQEKQDAAKSGRWEACSMEKGGNIGGFSSIREGNLDHGFRKVAIKERGKTFQWEKKKGGRWAEGRISEINASLGGKKGGKDAPLLGGTVLLSARNVTEKAGRASYF